MARCKSWSWSWSWNVEVIDALYDLLCETDPSITGLSFDEIAAWGISCGLVNSNDLRS